MGKICMVNIYKYIWTFLPELIRKNFNQLNLLGNVIKITIIYLSDTTFLYYKIYHKRIGKGWKNYLLI